MAEAVATSKNRKGAYKRNAFRTFIVRMRNNTPNEIALYTGLITSGSIGVVLLLVFSLMGNIEKQFPLVIFLPLVTFVVIFLILRFAIEEFIHKKVKLIYKTIHSMKTTRQEEPMEATLNKDHLAQVSRDVESWAMDRKDEIRALKEQEVFRREFMGNMSHELKTPITNIQGYLQTLLEGGLEDDNINRDYLIRADKSVDRLIDLVEDLDSITKLESGQTELVIEKFNIVELTKEVFEALEINAQTKNITLGCSKNYERPIWVMADKSKIAQVLTNLILNSIIYGRKKGETEARFYDMDKNILVEIADNGPGIAKEHLPRLFERFYRVDKSRARNQGGTGLGLAIVKHIIDAHKQTINVRTTIDVGSTFSFTLKKA